MEATNSGYHSGNVVFINLIEERRGPSPQRSELAVFEPGRR
jgi:hypothetical protein